MMRSKFDEQLEQLNLELIKMGALCESAIAAAAKAIFDEDKALIEKTLNADEQIDRKERDIEDLCLKLLLRQQPVAADLRYISSALKMISDMERIGDQASDIAEITEMLGQSKPGGDVHLHDMAKATIHMVTESIESYVQKDEERAKAVIAYDDVVDDLFIKIRKELIEKIGADASSGEVCLDYLMIAKYFERIGDHAVNVAEWVIYSITGKHVGE